MKDFFSFFKSKIFFKNLILSIGSVILLLCLTFFLLKIYTRPDKIVLVPNFQGYHISELDATAKKYKIRFIVDSTSYDSRIKKGVVIAQVPKPGKKVKIERNIYVTVNPTRVQYERIPDYVNNTYTKRIMIAMLKIRNIDVKESRGSDDVAITGITYNGKRLKPNDKIERGEMVELEFQKISKEVKEVPILYGLTIKQALARLEANSLVMDLINPEDVVDSSEFVIYQSPDAKEKILVGSRIIISADPNSNHVPVNKPDSVQ